MSSSSFPRQLDCIVIGAGERGYGYSMYALDCPDRLKVVAVADPKGSARERMKNSHKLKPKDVYSDWTDVAVQNKFADFVIIATPDKNHREPAVAFARKGYHILLEKPMAISEEDCKEIAVVCKKNNVMICVCHVLRYDPKMKKIKDIIDSGAIGDVINIQHMEPVGYWHFAHAYVRGNWRKEAESTFSLLAKCCHDIDLIMWWMGSKKCEKLSSFGSLVHFTKANKPVGASSRCLDCSVEKTCPYSAKRLYLGQFKKGNQSWPVSVICNAEKPTLEGVMDALKTGPYGRCVYECDNDVCDNQVVNMSFNGGATANLTMIAFTEQICARSVKVFGTKGEINLSKGNLRMYDFISGQEKKFKDFPSVPSGSRLNGHGGSDFFLFDLFVTAVASNDPSLIRSGADDSLASHLLVFEAEKSRKENRIVDVCKEIPGW